jgi:Tfp pilus assembly protein PilO
VLNDILQLAKDAGLTVRDYQPATAVAKAGCRQIPIHLSGAGDYQGIYRFLDGLERLVRLTMIEKLEVAAAPAAPYAVAATVAVYFTGQAAANGQLAGAKNG